MNKAILIPASFKNCLTSLEASGLMEASLKRVFPDCQTLRIPISDGGEGLVDCFLSAVAGKRVTVKTSGPFGSPIDSFYGLLSDGTAVIEMAASAGLPLVKNHPDPSLASTYGVGELIRHALGHGAKKMVLGLGGSATNDAGTGMAKALGIHFFRADGTDFLPTGSTLSQIADITVDDLLPALKTLPFVVLCDVKNPLSGPTGAARVYARQKGADEAMIALLDRNLATYAAFLKTKYGFDAEFEGAGAAGGTTVAAKLFLGADIRRGIDTVLDLIRFDDLLDHCDAVFTGEGRLDSQSFQGKVIDGLAARTVKRHVPLYALVGRIGDVSLRQYPPGLTAVFPISDPRLRLETAIASAPEHLRNTMETLCRQIRKTENLKKNSPF